jgi:hypothetical protein
MSAERSSGFMRSSETVGGRPVSAGYARLTEQPSLRRAGMRFHDADELARLSVVAAVFGAMG